ncbi:MAG TPA: NYN domain-containing protein [Candidatus Krumholzibacteria bacterium]|nr:NYN domain-containing protein [Candidatus Krumholzibacteria bacterium]
MAERVAIFVDGANVYFAQKEALGWWIEWPRFLAAMREGRELVAARWYQAYNRTPEPEQERFLHHLTLIGFSIRKKVLKQVFDRTSGTYHMKGSLDIELAIDALSEADHYDTAVFVTGDSDFVPLLETLQRRGKRVMVAATPQNVAVELRQQVGVNFIDLNDLRDAVESDKRPPEPRERRENGTQAQAPSRAAADEDEYDDEYEDEYDDEYDEYDDEYDDEYEPGMAPEPIDPESIDLPEVGDVVECRVQTVKKYGVFLDLHQHAKTLLHVKDMNRGFVPDAGAYYEVGQEIPVRVVSIDRRKSPPEVRVAILTAETEASES